jgi:hypothetical protein
MKQATDAEWIVPSLALTLGIGIVCVILGPNSEFLVPATFSPVGCMIIAWVFGSIWMVAKIFSIRPASPLAEAMRILVFERNRIAFLAAIVMLIGAALMVFTWIKSLLNLHVAFTEDPALALFDYRLFFGHDPWIFVTWLDFPQVGQIYHRAWFFAIIAVTLVSAAAPKSAQKSAIMLSFFMLWLVVGPLIHILLPAAGPIFFERMGYGPRFAGLTPDRETVEVANMLWATYASHGSLAGAGISAMPSLHIAMVTWMTLAIRAFEPRFFRPMLAFAVLIFALSVALGWHYAVDGLIGAASSVLCYLMLWSGYSLSKGAGSKRVAIGG